MSWEDLSIAGFLLVLGGVVCILGIIVSEALYPGYSTSQNYISDLGVGPSAFIFNFSVFLLGVLILFGAYFIHRAFKVMFFSVLVVLAGVGAVGVGIFTEDAGVVHTVFSLIVFLFGGLSAVASSKFQKPPFSYFSVVLGVVSLLALVLFASGNYFGLGRGGMERLIAYPTLLWSVAFGGYLMGESDKT
jgi:hypothetical membrane protein